MLTAEINRYRLMGFYDGSHLHPATDQQNGSLFTRT